MPTFEIEQFEIHAMIYRVEAETEAETLNQVLDGTSKPTVSPGCGLFLACHRRRL